VLESTIDLSTQAPKMLCKCCGERDVSVVRDRWLVEEGKLTMKFVCMVLFLGRSIMASAQIQTLQPAEQSSTPAQSTAQAQTPQPANRHHKIAVAAAAAAADTTAITTGADFNFTNHSAARFNADLLRTHFVDEGSESQTHRFGGGLQVRALTRRACRSG
jgi:hypothetical protein